MGRKYDLKDRGHPTPGQRRLAKGWLEAQDPELAAMLSAPGSRKEKRDRLAAYLKARPKVEQDEPEALTMPSKRTDPQRELAEFTDEQLDAMAEVTPEDIERAKLAWRRDTAGTGFERLLDAEPADDDEPEGDT